MEEEQEERFYGQWLEDIMFGCDLGFELPVLARDVFGDQYFLPPAATRELPPYKRPAKLAIRKKAQRTGRRERSNVPTLRPSSTELLHVHEAKPVLDHPLSNKCDHGASYDDQSLTSFPEYKSKAAQLSRIDPKDPQSPEDTSMGSQISQADPEDSQPLILRKAEQCGHFMHPSLPEFLRICPICMALTKVAALGYREKEWDKLGGLHHRRARGVTQAEWRIARTEWHARKAEVASLIMWWEDMVNDEEQWDKEHPDDLKRVKTEVSRASNALRIARRTIPEANGENERRETKSNTTKRVRFDGNLRVIPDHHDKTLEKVESPEMDDWDERYYWEGVETLNVRDHHNKTKEGDPNSEIDDWDERYFSDSEPY